MGIKESNRVKIEVERTSAHELEGPPPAFRTSCRRGASRWAPAQPGSSSSRGVGAAWRRHDGRRTAAVSAAGRMLGGPAAAPKSRGSEQLASGGGGGGLGLNPDLFPCTDGLNLGTDSSPVPKCQKKKAQSNTPPSARTTHYGHV
jgi:hypothetical protein